MALSPAFGTTGTNSLPTAPAPTRIYGSYICGTSALTNTVTGQPNNGMTILPFTPANPNFTTQGGSLAIPTGSPVLGVNDYFFVDGAGVLYVVTSNAAFVANYTPGSTYTLNLYTPGL